jgi:hypothetical protein
MILKKPYIGFFFNKVHLVGDETLKQTVRTRISETCTGASVTLRRVTSLEIM